MMDDKPEVKDEAEAVPVKEAEDTEAAAVETAAAETAVEETAAPESAAVDTVAAETTAAEVPDEEPGDPEIAPVQEEEEAQEEEVVTEQEPGNSAEGEEEVKEVEETIPNGDSSYFRRTPVNVRLQFEEEEPEDLPRISRRPRSTDWLEVDNRNRWFTEPSHLNLNGTRRSEDLDSSAVEDYIKSIDKMDNIRESIDSLRRDLELSELRDDLNRSRLRLGDDLELSRSYRLAAEELDDIAIRRSALETQIWSEAAPRPRLISSATPYRDHINTLRLRSLRLEEKRLLEIRRLQELERLRGPQPKWYELKTSQFHKEAKKNNELLAAKRQWNDLRDYTENVWRSRDLSRSATCL